METPIIKKSLGYLYPKPTSKQKRKYVIAICPYCNNDFKTAEWNLKSGGTTKCRDCSYKIKDVNNRKHGDTETRLYKIWTGMTSRCYNKNNYNYQRYGGRGIKVCIEWREYKSFKEWSIENGYQDDLSIDRINNNGNYEPDNCRWADSKTQNRNTRKINSRNTSGYRGVSLSNNKKKWCAYIRVDYKLINLGRYDLKTDAAKAYDNYITEHNLEHTRNFNHV